MSRDDVEARIKQLLASELDVAPDVLAAAGPTTALLGRGIGLDSMETLMLAACLETEFGICIEDEDLTVELFASLRSLSTFVATALSKAGQTDRV